MTSYYDTSYPPSLWQGTTPPTFSAMTPTTGVTGASVSIQCTGTRFTPGSIVHFNNAPITTTYVSATRVDGGPITLPVAGTYPVKVVDGTNATPVRNFTVTATGELQSEPIMLPLEDG